MTFATKMKWKGTIATILAALGLYIGSYICLSAMGGYRFDQSGLVRYGGGMAASDLELWHPRRAWFQSGFMDAEGRSGSRGNVLGYFFSPLICADRAFVHKTKVIEELRKQSTR